MKKEAYESIKNVTKISTGTVLGQIISIISLPFITRIYGAEIVGIWALITSFANIITNICDIGLSNSLMMCQNEVLSKYYSLILVVSNSLSIISGLVIFLYYFATGSIITYAIMIGFFAALYGFLLRWVNISLIVLNRNKEYNALMLNSLLRFSTIAIISIGLGILGFKGFGYFIGNILGQFVTILHMMKYLPKFKFNKRFDEYIYFFKKHSNYMRYQMPASISVTLRTDLPNLLIGKFFGNEILGYFSVSQKLLTIPITFLGQSLGNVFYQKAAEKSRRGINIGEFVKRNINRGMIFALIPMTILAAYGDVAVVLYFGTEYAVAGIICRIIAFRAVFNFVSTATQGLDVVINKQQYVLITCLTQTIAAAASVFCGYYFFYNIYITACFLVTSFIIIQMIYFIIIYRSLSLNPWNYIKVAISTIVIMVFLSIFLRVITIQILNNIQSPFSEILLKSFVR